MPRDRLRWIALEIILFLVLALIGFSLLGGWQYLTRQPGAASTPGVIARLPSAQAYDPPPTPVSTLSPVFTPEVQYWADDILTWADKAGLDPNLVATAMQIESCGDPMVVSSSDAQGLFQVMPYHFATDEDMLDPDTNAKRGLEYLRSSLEKADGHVGLALAGYNGGHAAIERGWANWLPETRRYFHWGSGIYREAAAGWQASPTLLAWLEAGGRHLCARAAIRQALLADAAD
jgi:soluble lytic murein transglycosylase-like protein